MEREMALWLTGLIIQTLSQLEDTPGLTCEVEGDSSIWIQIVPEDESGEGKLSGFLLNFAFHHSNSPISALEASGVTPPPGTILADWEADGFATLWIRPDVPVVALAHFVGDILEKIQLAPTDYQLTAKIEHEL